MVLHRRMPARLRRDTRARGLTLAPRRRDDRRVIIDGDGHLVEPTSVWRDYVDPSQRGAIQHYYTGYMVALKIGGSPASQTIEVSIETYLAAFAQASNRSYLDQELFDPGDLSARAAVAIANGVSGNPLVSNTPTPGNGAGAGGGGGLYTYRQFE